MSLNRLPQRACFHTALAVAVFVWSGPATAAPVNVSVEYQVVAVDPGVTSIAVGDRFLLELTIEDSTADTNASTSHGTFPGLITALTMSSNLANTGSWAASGTFDLAGGNYVTASDHITFQVRGTGFPDSGDGGFPFWDVSVGFSWPDGITDGGLGFTWAQQLGAPFAAPPATLDSSGIRFQAGVADFREATIVLANAVPVADPELLLLLAAALIALGSLTLRRPRRRALGSL